MMLPPERWAHVYEDYGAWEQEPFAKIAAQLSRSTRSNGDSSLLTRTGPMSWATTSSEESLW